MAKYNVDDKVSFLGFADKDVDDPEGLVVGAEVTIKEVLEEESVTPVEGSDKEEFIPACYMGTVELDGEITDIEVYEDEIQELVNNTTVSQDTKVAQDEPAVKKKAPAKTKAKAEPKKKAAAKPKVEEKPQAEADGGEVTEGQVSINDELADMLEADGALLTAKTLDHERHITDYLLGGAVDHLYVTGEFGQDGKYSVEVGVKGEMVGFKSFCDDELAIGYRKAMVLRQNYLAVKDFGDEAIERICAIGWSKAWKISQALNGRDDVGFEDLLEYAETHSRKDLEAYIKEEVLEGEETTTTTGESSTMHTVSVKLFEGQMEAFNLAMRKMREQEGETEDNAITTGKALMALINEHMGMTENKDVLIPEVEMLEILNRRYGKAFVAVDNTNAETEVLEELDEAI